MESRFVPRSGAAAGVLAFGAALSVILAASAALAAPSSTPDAFTRALSLGPLYAGLAAFGGGLLVSLTPCVYPMITVTVSVFGARQTKSRLEGALLSGAFVLGIVAMFVSLGVGAAFSGEMFGAVLQNRWVIVGISALFLVLAAGMFGLFEFALPSGLNNRLAQIGGIGYKGAFALGLVCGIIAAPCTGPVLTGILTWIAQTRSLTLAIAAMSAFALGLGAPFFVVGAFAVELPKSGRWMLYVKSFFGIALVGVALYFLGTTFPALSGLAEGSGVFFGVVAVMGATGIALGAFHKDLTELGPLGRVGKLIGVVLVSIAGFLAVSAVLKPSPTSTKLSWRAGSPDAVKAQAVQEKRPLLVDFTAAWCLACKELEKKTFSEARVAQEAGRFIAVRVDLTNDDDPNVEATRQKFAVKGLPTVLVYDSRGNEALRYTDFVDADRFLEAIRHVD
jgi:thiol:disulfide interchange protein DsbD